MLLGLKKTGFGAGKIVGLGGHVEPGGFVQAVCREVHEESGVVVRQEELFDAGEVRFVFPLAGVEHDFADVHCPPLPGRTGGKPGNPAGMVRRRFLPGTTSPKGCS